MLKENKRLLKKSLNLLLSYIGYEVVSKKKLKSNKNRAKAGNATHSKVDDMLLPLLSLKFSLISRRKFNIIQVGANDGIANDPIYQIAKQFRDFTNLLLIEPQKEVFEELKENYNWHPSAQFENVAIKCTDSETLYRIKPELWKHYKGIIGSGITSHNKRYVEKKALNQLPNYIKEKYNHDLSMMVEAFKSDFYSLKQLLEKVNFSSGIDLLQTDVEGYDDQLLKNNEIEKLNPHIISFENSHFDQKRSAAMNEYLNECGYLVFQLNKADACAIKIS